MATEEVTIVGTYRTELIPKAIFGNRREDNDFTNEDPRKYNNKFKEVKIGRRTYIRNLGILQWKIDDLKAMEIAEGQLEQAVAGAREQFKRRARNVKIMITVNAMSDENYTHQVEYELLE